MHTHVHVSPLGVCTCPWISDPVVAEGPWWKGLASQPGGGDWGALRHLGLQRPDPELVPDCGDLGASAGAAVSEGVSTLTQTLGG